MNLFKNGGLSVLVIVVGMILCDRRSIVAQDNYRGNLVCAINAYNNATNDRERMRQVKEIAKTTVAMVEYRLQERIGVCKNVKGIMARMNCGLDDLLELMIGLSSVNSEGRTAEALSQVLRVSGLKVSISRRTEKGQSLSRLEEIKCEHIKSAAIQIMGRSVIDINAIGQIGWEDVSKELIESQPEMKTEAVKMIDAIAKELKESSEIDSLLLSGSCKSNGGISNNIHVIDEKAVLEPTDFKNWYDIRIKKLNALIGLRNSI